MSDVPRRPFGKDGEEISILGIGGGHLGGEDLAPAEAVRIMHRAIDEGVTTFDNAWEYSDGEAEVRMGKAIADRRDKVFLMTKVCARDRTGAEAQLEESLRRLKTDHVDLWQLHEINYGNDPEWIFSPGGAIEAAEAALKSGKTRYVGFTGHKDPAYLLDMLHRDFPWASVLMPVNILDPSYHRSFVRGVLPEARKRGVSVLGMKSLGGIGQFISEGNMDVADCLRFPLSQDISCLISGIDSMDVLDQHLGVVRSFEPMNDVEQAAALAIYRELGVDGHLERFKTTQYFDSRIHRDQHHFPEVTTIN